MDRKNSRKQRRKEAIFLKKEPELRVRFQHSPSCHVLVSNGGLNSGVCREVLLRILSTQQIYMPPGKDYAFATFSCVSKAEEVVESINGVCVQDIPLVAELLPGSLLRGPPLHIYLSYVVDIPDMRTSPCTLSILPPGLVIVPGFVTPVEEEGLMALLYSPQTSRTHLKQRAVVHYGYQFNYDTNNVDLDSPLPGGFPPQIKELVSKMVASGHVYHTPDQLTVNCYPPGAGVDHCHCYR